MTNKKTYFQVYIFLTSEDDKYCVKGGIGTYTSILTRTIKQLYPSSDVVWIIKSEEEKEWEELDLHGVRRIYVGKMKDIQKQPFFQAHRTLQNSSTASLFDFYHRAYAITNEIIQKNHDKSIMIESGEWEGHANLIFNIQRKNVCKVVRIHTPMATCMQQNHIKLTDYHALQLLAEYYTLQKADYISSCTHYTKQRLIDDVLGPNHPLSKNIDVIPNPVDVEGFSSISHTRASSINYLKKTHHKNIDPTTFNVFMIGSVEKRKGADIIVDSIQHVASKIPQVRYFFFGHYKDKKRSWQSGNTKLDIQDLYDAVPEKYHQNLHFFGYLDHEKLPKIIPAGDIFPILSLGDNFPGSVAEISLAGKPIIALERGGVKEMLTDEQGNFCAISIGSDLKNAEKNLADKIISCFNQREKIRDIGKRQKAHIKHTYNPEQLVPKMLATYYRAWDAQRREWKSNSV